MTKDKTVDELVDEMYKHYPFDMDNAVDTLLNRVVKKLQSLQKELDEAVKFIIDGETKERTSAEWDAWDERKEAFLKKMETGDE